MEGDQEGAPQEFRYRFEDAYNADGKPYLRKFTVSRHTPRGVMIWHYGEEKFVLAGVDGKRFAYPTEEQALQSYIKRKRRAILLIGHSLAKQQAMLDSALGNKLEKDEFFQFTG